MEAKMEKIETNVVKIEVRVGADQFKDALNKAYNKRKGSFNVPGFRKGKVPMQIVKKFYGIEVLYDEAINFAIDATYTKALDENNIRPVDYPEVDVLEIGEGKDFVYTATVTTYPEVELGEYKGLDVKKNEVVINEEEVENRLKTMAERNARVETKTEGTVEMGNIAVIDFKGFIDGVAFEGGEGNDYSLEIGSKTFIDTFEDQLVGASMGEEKEVKVTFPENYGKEELNNKEAVFKVTVKEIKVKELPALDDEFAKEVSEFDTIEEVKEDIRKEMREAAEKSADREFEEALITAAVDNAKMEIPAVMVSKETDKMVGDLENRLKYQGLTLEQYLQFTGSDMDKIREQMKENAERKVKADLVLEKIIEVEEIKATEEEMKEKALEVAKMYSASEHEKMADMLVKTQSHMLAKDVEIGKAIELMKANVKNA